MCGSTSENGAASSAIILPHLLVHARIQHARPGAQVRFEGLNLVGRNEPLDRIVSAGILQVAENSRLGGADLDAGRFEPAGDAVIAQRAFFRGLGLGIQEAAAVRAGLNADRKSTRLNSSHVSE